MRSFGRVASKFHDQVRAGLTVSRVRPMTGVVRRAAVVAACLVTMVTSAPAVCADPDVDPAAATVPAPEGGVPSNPPATLTTPDGWTLGLGANTPIATGNQSDSLHALVNGHVIELRVPYPMGFFAKGLDGRIDDPNGGWKGRGLWVTSGNRTPVHIEGIDAPAPGAPGASPETASSPLVVNFQLRPNPLAH